MSKIQTITVANLKALSKITVDFKGCSAIITGKNNSGKSSLLKTTFDRIRNGKLDNVLKQGEKEGFAEFELTTGEKFQWTFSANKEKLVFISDKKFAGPVTKEISKFYLPPVFEVDEFLNSAPAKQKAILQKLTGIDFTDFDLQYKEAFENRTWANKKVVEEKAKLEYVDPKLSTKIQPIADLEKQLQNAEVHNLNAANVEKRINEKDVLHKDYTAQIKVIQDKMKVLETDMKNGREWLNNPKNSPKTDAYIAEVKEFIEAQKNENIEIENNNKAIIQQESYEKCVEQAAELDKEVKALNDQKLDIIKNSTMPEGFGFDDDGITYEGFAFNKESLSSSRIYIASLKLALLGIGEIRMMHFDASYLDKNSLAEIENWAKQNDLQLLIERPDFEAGEIKYELIQDV